MKTIAAIVIGLILTSNIVLATSKGNEKDAEKVAESTALNVNLSGKVVDITTGEALVGVTLKIDGTNQIAYTDFDGNFTFSNILPGTVSISASYISYEKATLNFSTKDAASIKLSLKSIE